MNATSRPRRMYFVLAACALLLASGMGVRMAFEPAGWSSFIYMPTIVGALVIALALCFLGTSAERRKRGRDPA
ncbi:MAG: hypothetical protein V4510_07140 [bacterium]